MIGTIAIIIFSFVAGVMVISIGAYRKFKTIFSKIDSYYDFERQAIYISSKEYDDMKKRFWL